MHVQQVKEVVAGRTYERIERRFGALGVDFARIALEAGFHFVDHVAVVRRGKALDDPRLKSRAEQQAFMLRGFSHLLIFQKPLKAAATKTKWGRSPTAAAAAAPWTPRSSGTTQSASKLPPKPRGARGEREERASARTPAGGRKPAGGRRPKR